MKQYYLKMICATIPFWFPVPPELFNKVLEEISEKRKDDYIIQSDESGETINYYIFSKKANFRNKFGELKSESVDENNKGFEKLYNEIQYYSYFWR